CLAPQQRAGSRRRVRRDYWVPLRRARQLRAGPIRRNGTTPRGSCEMRGSIVKRMTKPRDGSKPKARYYVKIGTGSSQRWFSDPATGSGFTRKADAEAHLARTVAAMNAGTWVAPSAVTTGEHLVRDLELAK